MSTGTPGTEVIPTQHEERTADDVDVSQTLTYIDFSSSNKKLITK